MPVGPKRSGKGTICRVLRALIGPENVCGPTLASLGDRFGRWPLLGKSLAIIHDARLGRADAGPVVECLLNISGEDAVTIDRKNLEPITCKLPTRLVLVSNELPRLIDASGAMASRVLLLRLTESFYGREDPSLTDRLLTELPGILLWAIQGWKRLRERGHFVQPASGAELLDELHDLTSPVGQFVREKCIMGPACRVLTGDLYTAYTDWAKAHGRDHVEDEAGFGRLLRAACPTVTRSQARVEGERQRFYEGVTLRMDF
jgi:putative DNA primase/helicase